MIPGVVLSSLAIIIASRLGAAASPAMEKTFDAVQDELRLAKA
jgi:hypothetical protein